MAALTEATAALQAVKLDGFALADQPKKLRDDDKLVLAAVSENGGALSTPASDYVTTKPSSARP